MATEEKKAKEREAAIVAKEADITAREENIKRDMEALKLQAARVAGQVEVMDSRVAYGTVQEFSNTKRVKVVSPEKAKETAELSKFMNQLVEIVVHKDPTAGALEVIVVNVNGTNQPIIRGEYQKIRRKYVECLARSVITNYEQLPSDMTKPEAINMKETTANTYPFTVISDPNKGGKEWLRAIEAEPK